MQQRNENFNILTVKLSDLLRGGEGEEERGGRGKEEMGERVREGGEGEVKRAREVRSG